MKISIRANGFKLSAAQRAFAEQRIGLSLGRFGDRVALAVLHLAASKNGDLRARASCQLEVTFRPKVFQVEESDADFRAAVRRMADRAARRVERALEREAPVRSRAG